MNDTEIDLSSKNRVMVQIAMRYIWAFVKCGFVLKSDPLPSLRKGFPMLDWEYVRTEPAIEEEGDLFPEKDTSRALTTLIRSANYLWDFDKGILGASHKKRSGRRFSMAFKEADIEDLLSRGKHVHFDTRKESPSAWMLDIMLSLLVRIETPAPS